MSPCMSTRSRIEGHYSPRLQQSTAQTRRNREQMVERPGAEDVLILETIEASTRLQGQYMNALIRSLLSLAVMTDRTSSLTIRPSLLIGLSTSRASSVLTEIGRTLPPVDFLSIYSNRSLSNLIPNKKRLRP